mgnify:CR=1 FL=1
MEEVLLQDLIERTETLTQTVEQISINLYIVLGFITIAILLPQLWARMWRHG